MKSTRRAFTLVEMMVTLGLFLLCFGMLYNFWVSSTRHSVELEARITALRKAHLALVTFSQEIRLARRILYPAPGVADATGVAFIDAAGRPVMYALEPATAPGASRRLYRLDHLTGQRRQVTDGVLDLKCRVPPCPSGRDPDIVHVTFVMEGARGRPLYLASSARPLALDLRCPLSR